MNRGKWGLFALSCGALLGCSDPFAFTISKVNEDAPQEGALIQLSAPQVYTRERLINDRREEVTYLRKVLKESETARFTPAIKRELESIVAIAVALQAGFNPIAGAQAQRQEDLAQLQQQALEIELQKRITILEAELSKLRADQAAAEAGDAQTSVDTSKPITNPSDTGTNKQSVPTADAKAIQAELAPIVTALKDLVAAINTDSGAAPKAANIEATPQEVFRDREAYREEIRRVLAQTELDDRHDQNGLSLYSLKFLASVFPGKTKDVYGVAAADIAPPAFVATTQREGFDEGHLKFENLRSEQGQEAVIRWNDLYKTWLAHLTMRLNQRAFTPTDDSETRLQAEKSRIAMLGTVSGAFGVLPIEETSISVALPVQEVEFVRYLTAYRDYAARYQVALETARAEVETLTQKARSEGKPGPVAKFALQRVMVQVPTQAGAESAANGVMSPVMETVEQCEARFAQENIPVGKELDPTTWLFIKSLLIGEAADGGPAGLLAQSLPSDPQKKEIAENLKAADAVTGLTGLLDPIALQLVGISSPQARSEMGSTGTLTHNTLLTFGKRLIQNSQTLASLIVAAQEAKPEDAKLKTLRELGQQFQVIYRASVAYATAVMRANAAYDELSSQKTSCSEMLEIDRLANTLLDASSIEEFAETLLSSQDGQQAYAYSTGPRELVQTVSTVQTATEALQLVAALSAVLPTQGINASLAASISKSATGKIEALERNPIIVGFSRGDMPEATEPTFGWVFGPRVTVDSDDKNLQLQQTLKSEPVQADIAIPGWWPEVRLDVKSFWSGSPSRDINGTAAEAQAITVPLHNDRAVMDRITDIVAGANWGDRPTSTAIREIFPSVINVCQSSVAIQIVGANLWRGAEVYLDGVAAELDNIRVLPDMEGIAVTFPGSQLRAALLSGGDHALSVWTYDGADRYVIKNGGMRADCGSAVANLGGVTLLQSAIVGGGPLELAVEGGLPSVRDSVEVVGRGINTDKYFIISDAPAIAPSGNVFVSAVPKEVLKLPDGSELVVGLRIKTSSGTAAESTQVSEAATRLISYKDRPSLTIQPGKRNGTEVPLVIGGVPPGFAKAYPQLIDGSVQLSATNVGKELSATITLDVIPDGDPVKIGGDLKFTGIAAADLAALLAKEPVVLDISHNARDTLKGVLPAIIGTITLAKEP